MGIPDVLVLVIGRTGQKSSSRRQARGMFSLSRGTRRRRHQSTRKPLPRASGGGKGGDLPPQTATCRLGKPGRRRPGEAQPPTPPTPQGGWGCSSSSSPRFDRGFTASIAAKSCRRTRGACTDRHRWRWRLETKIRFWPAKCELCGLRWFHVWWRSGVGNCLDYLGRVFPTYCLDRCQRFAVSLCCLRHHSMKCTERNPVVFVWRFR